MPLGTIIMGTPMAVQDKSLGMMADDDDDNYNDDNKLSGDHVNAATHGKSSRLIQEKSDDNKDDDQFQMVKIDAALYSKLSGMKAAEYASIDNNDDNGDGFDDLS